MFKEFTVPSSRGDADLHCVEWGVENPKATVQISHGMIEHITRYAEFAEYLNGRGYAVIGHDHLGHGDTTPDDLGLIAEDDGDEHLVEDVFLVTKKIDEMHPGIPHFILGHSMGSFVVRRYLTRYGDMVDGAVIVGTGNQSGLSVAFAKLVASVLVKMKGPRYVSPFLDKAVLGGNDRKFDEPDLPNRWISRDPEVVKAYNSDPYCTFSFTVAGYRDLMTLIQKVIRRQDLDRVPKGLPIILVSGADDPVGGFGKGVEKAKAGMEKAGLKPGIRLYEGGRHEILNETNRSEVRSDVADWLDSHVSQRSYPERRRALAGVPAHRAEVPVLRVHPEVPVAGNDQVGPLEPVGLQRLGDRLLAVHVHPCHGHGGVAPVRAEPLEGGLAHHGPHSVPHGRLVHRDGVQQADELPGADAVVLRALGEGHLLGDVLGPELPAQGEPCVLPPAHGRHDAELPGLRQGIEEIPLGDVVQPQLVPSDRHQVRYVLPVQLPYLDAEIAVLHSSSLSSSVRSRYFPWGRSPRRMFMTLTLTRRTTVYPSCPHILRICLLSPWRSTMRNSLSESRSTSHLFVMRPSI